MKPEHKKALDRMHPKWVIFQQSKELSGLDHDDLKIASEYYQETFKELPENIYCSPCVIAMLSRIYTYGYTPTKTSSINE